MKKIFTLAAFAALVLGLASCEKDKLCDGSITVRIQNPYTKASTAPMEYETALNKVHLMVFDLDNLDADGSAMLYKEVDLVSPFTTAKVDGVVPGNYEVWCVANGGSLDFTNPKCKSLKTLKERNVSIVNNSVDKSAGFIMRGSAQVKVEAKAGSTVNIELSRYTARVALTKVSNRLISGGALQIDYVMLTNGVANQNIEGSQSPAGYINEAGRFNGAIIKSAGDATGGALTFKDIKNTIASGNDYSTTQYAYSYPTGGLKDKTTYLVVAATIGSVQYYYPVALPELVENSAYDVAVIINGKGSDDPNVPVSKSDLTATVKVKDWNNGGDIVETL